MLVAFSRRDTYTLGFAPVPVILSINLFLWFRADWFYLQFLLIAVGFATKDLIRWTKGGRRVHVFNPSSFPLGLFSLVLLLTGTSGIAWGYEIANTLNYPPHIYLFIFLVSLPGQLLFGVTTMTMSAVVTMYAFGLLYFASTGTYYFFDSYIPIAVFLGMHLLFNDPSTSPRTEHGRIMFGVVYADFPQKGCRRVCVPRSSRLLVSRSGDRRSRRQRCSMRWPWRTLSVGIRISTAPDRERLF